MNTEKLKLKDLIVKSFITGLNLNEKQTINGGATNGVAGCVGPDMPTLVACPPYKPELYVEKMVFDLKEVDA
jgi:hypothetical protein